MTTPERAAEASEKLVLDYLAKTHFKFELLMACGVETCRAGWSNEDWEAFAKEAWSGDCIHLLRTVMERFDVR